MRISDWSSDVCSSDLFENTHVPMMLAGDTMDRIFAMWGVQTSNKSSDRVEDIDAEWSPKLTTFYTELFLDPKLFEIGRAHAELQSLMRISYAVFCLKKKKNNNIIYLSTALTLLLTTMMTISDR